MRKAIAIDFDGCICTDAFPFIGKPNWPVIELAKREQESGAGLILWTCREGPLLQMAVEACRRWGLEFDAINESLPDWIEEFGNRPRKVGASEYWDDKAIRIPVFTAFKIGVQALDCTMRGLLEIVSHIREFVHASIKKSGGEKVTPATSHKESFYQAKIIKWLKDTYPSAFVWKAAAGPYSRGGIPDICAIIDGRFFGFEVKRPGIGKLTKLQEQTIKQINAAGGFAAVVSFPEDARMIIIKQKISEHTKTAIHVGQVHRDLLQRLNSAEETLLILEKVTGLTGQELIEKFLAGFELTREVQR